MAIAARRMSHEEDESNKQQGHHLDEVDDEHEHDMVMPGFRFHPTEEELIEFYLRRKVEGKRFNVELITFLDLYRYDPWELPAMAAIGEKEWFFYVPRDRKYRNGDRPNRVTTSGYWKATGADRMIRSENFRSIGLKKTLVFYSGKAPKGIRTSWIMNEYRLPHHETERYQKGEISLCRVYKRPGVEDHPSLPRLSSRAATHANGASSSRSLPAQSSSSSLSNKKQHSINSSLMEKLQANFNFNGGSLTLGQSVQKLHHHQDQVAADPKINETEGSSGNSDVTSTLGVGLRGSAPNIPAIHHPSSPLGLHPHHHGGVLHLDDHAEQEGMSTFLQQHHHHSKTQTLLFAGSSVPTTSNAIDDLQRLLNYQQQQAVSNIANQQALNVQQYYDVHGHNHHQHHHHVPSNVVNQFSSPFPLVPPPPSQSQLSPNGLPVTAFSDRLWDWTPISEPNRAPYQYNTNPFK
ncbi:NAC domain-containing protein 35 [Argentina anserina]|uniref:NAC domain-containing protein 35 n=1 Tax=Argentina anserina TaxID=57926 RepID=UPI00217692AE|nr:NAC domain-containing protein 35 [Potentilla anserina]